MKQRKAFTIIEVVLVLAIAGLIFLMVFIALPALQRSQRNTRRRQDLARIATAVNDYPSNNSKLPFPWTTNPDKINYVDSKFVSRYIDENCKFRNASNNSSVHYNGTGDPLKQEYYGCSERFTDPDGTPYNLWSPTAALSATIENVFHTRENKTPTFEENSHIIFALAKAKCGTENKAELADGPNNFALFYLLEGGAVYCVDNQ